MQEEKLAVIFDTNAYRSLAHNRSVEQVLNSIAGFRQAEVKKDIQAFGAIITGMELLAHLAEGEGDKSYATCLSALVGMAHHCFDENINDIRITPMPSYHFARIYFSLPDQVDRDVKNMGGVIRDFKVDFEKALKFHAANSAFKDIDDWINGKEELFANGVIKQIEGLAVEVQAQHKKRQMEAINSGSGKQIEDLTQEELEQEQLKFLKEAFPPYYALVTIGALGKVLGIDIPPEQEKDRADSLLLNFPTHIGFNQWVFETVIKKKIDMQSLRSQSERWNWLWDSWIAFLVSNSTLSGRKVILVTSDRAIVEVLGRCGFSDRVYSLDDYRKFLRE